MARTYTHPCHCDAFRFPHRPESGDCTGGAFYCYGCNTYFDEFEQQCTFPGNRQEPAEFRQWCPACSSEEFEEVDR